MGGMAKAKARRKRETGNQGENRRVGKRDEKRVRGTMA